jgi:polyphosphate kinase
MPTANYFSRDLSWIEFNARVLEEGRRTDLPSLDRLRFLAIVSANFDEFFMVRVAALKRAVRANAGPDSSGLGPAQQLKAASARIRDIVALQYDCLMREVFPTLAKEGVILVRPAAYTAARKPTWKPSSGARYSRP